MRQTQIISGFVHSQAYVKAIACLVLACGGALPTLAASETSSNLSVQVVQQNGTTIKGVVVDEQGEPIIGASVVEQGSSNGTVTNLDGNYVLQLKKGGKVPVVISYIGYKSVTTAKGGKIILQADNKLLDELVVVGYGTQKKATLTGSVSQISGDDLQKVAATNVANTLAGKTAGIIANNRSGEPGADEASILIRGKGTLGDTSPLIVVDGVAGRSFSRLNPEDIESISVLKDASAAIYGARAANGVILVTTKRGSSGRTRVQYNGSLTFTQPTRIPKMLNSYQYATYVNEYDADDRHGQAGLTYSPEALEHYRTGDDPVNYPNTDWWGEVAKDWTTKTEHSLSISGGSDKVNYYLSTQYMNQNAIYKNSDHGYKQYQFASNLDAKLNKRVKLSLDLNFRQEERKRGVYSTPYLFSYLMSTFPGSAPYFPNGLPRTGYDGLTNNAAVMVSSAPGSNNSKNLIFNAKPKLHVDLDLITKGLYVEGYAGLDYTQRNGKQINQPYDLYEYDNAKQEYNNRRNDTSKISLNDWSSNYYTSTLNGRLGYNRTFAEKHKVGAFVAYEQSKYKYHTINAYRTNFLSNKLMDIFAGSDVPADKDNGGYSDLTTRMNYFGRINYSYMDKYLFEATVRVDGSMNFAPGHRWGTFPSFSAGWVISDEPFFKPLKNVVDFLKIRGSWGQMGNDNISKYQYLSTYQFTQTGAYFGAGEKGSINKGFYLTRTANPLVTWETANTLNLGISSTFLNNKFSLDIDWFQSRRRDILIRRNASIPSYSGLVLPDENLGKVNNSGIELVATYRDRKGDFEWSVTGNFTYAENKVKYMDEAASTPDWQRTTNHPIDGLILYHALGIYQTQEQVDNTPHLDNAKPGDLIYQDTNGDGKITWDDAVRINKSATPKILYGLTLNGSWKGIDLNVFFQGQAEAVQLVQPTMNMITDFYEGRWRADNTPEENMKARWPKAFIKQTYGDTWNGAASDWWLRNAAFLRLKSIELGYTIPKSITQKIGIEKFRVYINGNNLFTIDKMKVCDPEIGSSYNDDGYLINSNGILGYPLQRMVTIGTNVTF